MSYGQNLPWGLQPTRSLGASTWNGQTNPYFIQSGYNNNIFKGDPVVIAGTADAGGTQTGYIISIYDVNGNTYTAAPTFGVFDGCSFITPTATNPIDPASPGRQYWPAGTQTLNGVPAVANIVDDPNTVFNVQSGNPGVAQTDVGATYDYSIPVSGGGIVQGNTNTGTSRVLLSNTALRGAGTDVNNALVIAIAPSPPNPTLVPLATPQYNNVEVLIQNHQYIRRAIART